MQLGKGEANCCSGAHMLQYYVQVTRYSAFMHLCNGVHANHTIIVKTRLKKH